MPVAMPRRRSLRLPATRPPLRRLFWTLGQLRAGRNLKATDVATQFEVGVRTAYRDLDFLRDQLRTPIEYDRSRGSFVLTDPTAPLPAVMLSQGEVIALFFAERVLAQYRGRYRHVDERQVSGSVIRFHSSGVEGSRATNGRLLFATL